MQASEPNRVFLERGVARGEPPHNSRRQNLCKTSRKVNNFRGNASIGSESAVLGAGSCGGRAPHNSRRQNLCKTSQKVNSFRGDASIGPESGVLGAGSCGGRAPPRLATSKPMQNDSKREQLPRKSKHRTRIGCCWSGKLWGALSLIHI